jgi:predicted glycoside hydrolase/deacetylase ChbG (UPF0249 family)
MFSSLAKTKIAGRKLVTTEHFHAAFRKEEITEEILENILLSLRNGITEIACHPGYVDRELGELGLRVSEQREVELRALTSPILRKLIRGLDVRLVNFGGLGQL